MLTYWVPLSYSVKGQVMHTLGLVMGKFPLAAPESHATLLALYLHALKEQVGQKFFFVCLVMECGKFNNQVVVGRWIRERTRHPKCPSLPGLVFCFAILNFVLSFFLSLPSLLAI